MDEILAFRLRTAPKWKHREIIRSWVASTVNPPTVCEQCEELLDKWVSQIEDTSDLVNRLFNEHDPSPRELIK